MFIRYNCHSAIKLQNYYTNLQYNIPPCSSKNTKRDVSMSKNSPRILALNQSTGHSITYNSSKGKLKKKLRYKVKLLRSAVSNMNSNLFQIFFAMIFSLSATNTKYRSETKKNKSQLMNTLSSKLTVISKMRRCYKFKYKFSSSNLSWKPNFPWSSSKNNKKWKCRKIFGNQQIIISYFIR